ncbi:MAG: triphosphoribosyl-dephospho-CoA synthase CitG [Eubacteriales bacterium]|nr:triphosphoribosyl-dephospho-CoA synthase CitG [Eubacteriales bacterium]
MTTDFPYSGYCRRALMAEVSATPKPGLVDKKDSGAHRDMDFHTFEASTEAIVPHLESMFAMGHSWSSSDGAGLFAAIRPVGIEAEKSMFDATDGVNTHKGMIFSMGIISAAAGLYHALHGCFRGEPVLKLAGKLCSRELEKDFDVIRRRGPRTHGEILFMRYNMKGIRGEAQKGFPSVREISLPAYEKNKDAGLDDNAAAVNTLLALMSKVNDTNVLIRTNHNLLSFEKTEAARVLALGGAATKEGLEALHKLNKEFIRLNISPGGCADLLAVTILLWNLERTQP